MSDVERFLVNSIFPILEVLGVLLRPFGMLAIGLVTGSVLRHTLLFKFQQRFYVPLVFLGVVFIFGFSIVGRWSGPGSLGMLGLGLLAGFLALKLKDSASSEESENQEE